MAKLTEELAEALAISAREVSIRDGMLKLSLDNSLRGQTGVAFKEGLYDGSLLSYALTSSSSLFGNFWVAYLTVFTGRLLKL